MSRIGYSYRNIARYQFLGLIVFILICLTGKLQADEEPKTRIAIIDILGSSQANEKPLNYVIARNLCSAAQLDCSIISMPLPRAFKELESQQIDFVLALDSFPDKQNLLRIAKVETANIIILAKKKYTDCSDLAGMKLASIRNAGYTRRFVKMCKDVQIVWADNYDQMMKMYNLKRVDAIIGVGHNFSMSLGFSKGLTESDVVSMIWAEHMWLIAEKNGPSKQILEKLSSAIDTNELLWKVH